jgi:hypothetical protein
MKFASCQQGLQEIRSTLGRTWGTRPITFDFLATFDFFAGSSQNYAGREISNLLISPTMGP